MVMSKAPSLNPDDTDVPALDDPEQLVEEHRELLERIAAADLTISDRVQRALDHADGKLDGDRDGE